MKVERWKSSKPSLLGKGSRIDDSELYFTKGFCCKSLSSVFTMENEKSNVDISFDPAILEYIQTFAKYLELVDLSKAKISDGLKELQKNPFYSTLKSDRKVIIFDMDETILHYNFEENQAYIRPFVLDLLKSLSAKFDLWLWTSSLKEYADALLD